MDIYTEGDPSHMINQSKLRCSPMFTVPVARPVKGRLPTSLNTSSYEGNHQLYKGSFHRCNVPSYAGERNNN
jgi:hypothetical protein